MAQTPESQEDLQQLLEQIRGGSQEAVKEFVRTYGPHILRVVRFRLHKALRSKFDSVDFTQAVWASFFAVPEDFRQFKTPDELIAYLARMACNKVWTEVHRRKEFEKCNVDREQSIDDSALALKEQISAPHPSPSEVAMADEQWSRILKGWRASYRRILEMRWAGYTHEEIAAELGLTERTVRRVIQRVGEERVR